MSDSKAAQTSSVSTSSQVTTDSFNRTNNVVQNTSDSGNISLNLGVNEPTSGLSLDSSSFAYLAIGAVVVIGLFFIKRK